jgi:membrane protease YdiL (CAAX protease family)
MLDVALVILFTAAWPLAEYFWLWPRHVRAVEAGDPAARSRAYARTLLEQWALAAAVMALTLGFARPLSTLGLRLPQGWRLGLGVTLPAAYLLLIVVQGRVLAARPGALAGLRKKLDPLRALVPHTPGEFRLFVPLSITAGICEELLFRGYLVWVLKAWIGLGAAVGASMILFGLAHAYQGYKFGVRAFFAGVVMGALALVTGSILPGMALHALIDLGSGWVMFSAFRPVETASRPVAGTV